MGKWEQPKPTSNGVMGGDSFACEASSTVWSDSALAWGAFAGSLWHGASGLPQWISWYNPEPLKVSEIRIKNRNTSAGDADVCAPTRYKIQACNDNKSWIDLTDYIDNSIISSNLWQNPIEISEEKQDYYLYYRIYIEDHYNASGYTAIQKIEITATTKSTTEDNYFWLGWEQPAVKTDSQYGKISANNYLENCQPYKAVDGITSTESLGWATNGTAEGWWKWELPTNLRFKRLVFVNRNSDSNDPQALNQQCQFYIGNKAQKLGKGFSVSKSREYVSIDCNGEESNILYFYKLGGLYSGIGEIIIEATEEKKTGFLTYLKDVTKVYTSGKPVLKVYNSGKLIWQDPTLANLS